MATLGQYEVLERIGAGAMGEVFKARDTRHGRTVAIKRLPQAAVSSPARREALEREARAAAALSHPRIATLYEIGDDDGQPYLVFEYVPGESLQGVIAGRPLNPRRALDLAAQVADALAEAHAAGIVHRDLSPANVIITPRGHAKILDCGLSDFTGGGARRDAAVSAAADHGPPGTLAYISPEQALGERADGRSDIFSLGVILYEMLTGESPFAGRSAADTVVSVLQRTPGPPSRSSPAVTRDVDAIVQRALAKSLDARYQSAAEMAADLRAALAALEAPGTSELEPVVADAPDAGRGRGSMVALVLLVLLGAAVAAWWLFSR